MTEYELVVLGSGPAGHHADIQAAKLGATRAAAVGAAVAPLDPSFLVGKPS